MSSPHRLIPPAIKRSRTLVSGGVVIVKIICGCCDVCGCVYLAGKFLSPDILRLSESEKWQPTKSAVPFLGECFCVTNFRLSIVICKMGVSQEINDFMLWPHISDALDCLWLAFPPLPEYRTDCAGNRY
jgi:hypothetical protein